MRHTAAQFLCLIAVLTCGVRQGAAQETRPFLMSAGSIHAVPAAIGTQLFQNSSPDFPFSALAADVDVMSIFPEQLGVPFIAFAMGTAPPLDDPWTIQMTAMANEAKASGKPILLQLAFVRTEIVPLALNNFGVLKVASGWLPACPDFTNPLYAGIGAAYVKYAAWMVRTFAPSYVVTMIEPNLYYAACGGNTASWRALTGIVQATFDAVKSVDANIAAFPSFNLEALYGQDLNGFDQAQYDTMSALQRDRLGLVTYPWFQGSPYPLPIDYLTRIRDRNPSEPRIVVTETGWNSEKLSVYVGLFNFCADVVYSEPSFESAYLNFLIYSAYVGHFDMITWWSDRDMIDSRVMSTCYPPATPPDFLQCTGDFWCTAISYLRANPPPWTFPEFGEIVFKAFGSMGLRNYDGTPKSGQWDIWSRFLTLPRSP